MPVLPHVVPIVRHEVPSSRAAAAAETAAWRIFARPEGDFRVILDRPEDDFRMILDRPEDEFRMIFRLILG